MGGKTATSTQQVSIPPEVLAQYQAVNARASQTAATPFQQYNGQFVAPVNNQQTAGITGVNQAANQAQPYFSQATGQINNAQTGANAANANATSTLSNAQSGTAGYNAAAADSLGMAAATGTGYNTAATGQLANAQNGTTNLNGLAAGLAGASAGAVNPTNLDAASIQKYLSPYLGTVLQGTAGILNQRGSLEPRSPRALSAVIALV